MPGIERIDHDAIFRMPSTSHATKAGGAIYVTGVLGTKGSGVELVDGGVGPQTVQALRHVEAILTQAGATLADLVKVTVYLTTTDDFLEMDAAYASVVTTRPARTTVYCAAMPLGGAIEVDAIAVDGA